jgi:hypothetical protein
VSVEVPLAVRRFLTPDVAHEIAQAFGDQMVYPERIVVDRPGDIWRRFPGWPEPVLVLAAENQGVCSWGVQLGDDNGEVLVGGDLFVTGQATIRYAASVEDFIAARLWDHACLSAPLLQAQCAALDQASLDYLAARLTLAGTTTGWPGARQYRFEGHDVRVLLWAGSQQCDWFISASSEPPLKAFAGGLLNLSNLRRALYSSDDAGTRVLNELRGAQPHDPR